MAGQILFRIFGNDEVGLNHVHVFRNDCAGNIRIIPQFASLSNRSKIGMLYHTSQNLGTFSIPNFVWLLIDSHGRRSDILGDVQNLLETWDTQSDVLRGHTSKMEGVERHLCGWFADRLSSKNTNHFTRLCGSFDETCLNSPNDMIEC